MSNDYFERWVLLFFFFTKSVYKAQADLKSVLQDICITVIFVGKVVSMHSTVFQNLMFLLSFIVLNNICSWWAEVICETFSTQAELVKSEQNRVWRDKSGFVTNN